MIKIAEDNNITSVKIPDIDFLRQLVKSMEEGALKMEDACNANQIEYFNNLKGFILAVYEKIRLELA